LQVLKAIGDSIGSFIDMDDRFKRNPSRVVVHILVDLDLRRGFKRPLKFVAGKVELHAVGRLSEDYIKCPCDIYGHLVECLLKFSEGVWQRRPVKKPNPSKVDTKTREKASDEKKNQEKGRETLSKDSSERAKDLCFGDKGYGKKTEPYGWEDKMMRSLSHSII
jgi:hypothetical protein